MRASGAGARATARHPAVWIAVPLDRDRAFSDYGGAVLRLARVGAPKLVAFDGQYSVGGLTSSAEELDRRLLAGLERSVWDSVAAALRARLSDAAITAALAKMPESYRPVSAESMSLRLRERRDQLPALATKYYGQLARVVDIHAHRLGRLGHDPPVRRRCGRDRTRRGKGRRKALLPPPVHAGGDGGGSAVPARWRRRRRAGRRGAVTDHGASHRRGRPRPPRRRLARPANVRLYDGKLTYGPDSVVEAALDRRPWTRGRGGRLDPAGYRLRQPLRADHRGDPRRSRFRDRVQRQASRGCDMASGTTPTNSGCRSPPATPSAPTHSG